MGYRRKITGEEASKIGRAGKLFGRAAAAQIKHPKKKIEGERRSDGGIKKPEAVVFEGHRASSKGGKSGMKLGGRGKKPGKPTSRTAKFKATKKTK